MDSPPALPPLRVLVVADSTLAARAIVSNLRCAYDVSGAAGALGRFAKRFEHDVVLLSLQMKSIHGIEVYKELRDMFPRALRRIVFVFDDHLTRDEVEFLARVSNERVPLPLDPVTLMRLVERVGDRARLDKMAA